MSSSLEFACHLAQLVERWTVCGESTRHTSQLERFRVWGMTGAQCLWASWRVWLELLAGHNQAVSEGIGCAQLCAYVKTFDSKFCHRTGNERQEGRGQGQHNKLCLAVALSLWIAPLKRFREKKMFWYFFYFKVSACFTVLITHLQLVNPISGRLMATPISGMGAV